MLVQSHVQADHVGAREQLVELHVGNAELAGETLVGLDVRCDDLHPKPTAMRATQRPMSPVPTMPIALPSRSKPRSPLKRKVPCRTLDASTMRWLIARSNANVCSATA